MREKMKRFKINILVMCLFLTGCSLFSQPATDKGTQLVLNNTCNAPCFLGITPGITSEIQTRTITTSNSLFSNCKDYDNTNVSGFVWIECDGVSVVFQDKMVSSIGVATQQLTVEQVIQMYGKPDTLSVSIVSRSNEPYLTNAILWYYQFGLQVNLIPQKGNQYEILPSSQIEAVTFNDQERESWLGNIDVDKWNGYGVYNP